MTIDQALRWNRVWRFLSLDVTFAFGQQLWLSEFGDTWLGYIRSDVREDRVTGNDPEPRRSAYVRLRGFSNRFGVNALCYLRWWEGAVYIEGGDDRVPEFLWSMATYTAQNYLEGQGALSEALAAVRQRYGEASLKLADDLARVRWSDADKNTVAAEQRSLDSVLSTIKVIANANLFADIWHRTMTRRGDAFLQSAFNAMSSLSGSEALQFDPEAMPYPSSWEFELLPPPLVRDGPSVRIPPRSWAGVDPE